MHIAMYNEIFCQLSDKTVCYHFLICHKIQQPIWLHSSCSWTVYKNFSYEAENQQVLKTLMNFSLSSVEPLKFFWCFYFTVHYFDEFMTCRKRHFTCAASDKSTSHQKTIFTIFFLCAKDGRFRLSCISTLEKRESLLRAPKQFV